MVDYIVRRLLWTVVVLIGVSILTFSIIFLVPNDPGLTIAGPRASKEVRAQIEEELGLNEPLHIQYFMYMDRIFHGDLGTSWIYRQKVSEIVKTHLPYTLKLAFAGIFFEIIIGLPVGLISATKPYSFLDRILMILTTGSISAPAFLVGPILLFIFGLKLDLFPVGGYGSFKHIILPAVTIGLNGAAWYARIFRSSILDALEEDYVRTARAKGRSKAEVLFGHVIQNCLTPIVSLFTLDIGIFMGGIVVVETVFGWPGIGLSAWKAIRDMDMPVLMGTILCTSLFVCSANLLGDVLYGVIDPRIRLD